MKFICLLCILFASSVYAAEPETPPPMPLKQQEQQELLDKTMHDLDNLKAVTESIVVEKTNQCMKAIGNPDFCSCIANNAPIKVSFAQYVEFFGYQPEDFDYQKLSPDAKKLYDGVRNARDKCVNWKGKK